MTQYKAAIHPRTPLFLRASAGGGASAFHGLTSNSSIAYLAHENGTNLPSYRKQISAEHTKRGRINEIQLVSRLGTFTNNAQCFQTADSTLQASPSLTICGYNAVQRWEVPPTNISVHPTLTRAIPTDTSVWCKLTGSRWNRTDGALLPGKYGEVGGRITSHPGKELIPDFHSFHFIPGRKGCSDMTSISGTAEFMSLWPFFCTPNTQKILPRGEVTKHSEFIMRLTDMPQTCTVTSSKLHNFPEHATVLLSYCTRFPRLACSPSDTYRPAAPPCQVLKII